MTVPSRSEAASLLLSLDPPAWHVRHSRAVAEVAGWLAARIAANGASIDRGIVEAAALLHDVDKVLEAGDRASRLPHGAGSAAWLTRRGHPELADAVASHPVDRLVSDGWERLTTDGVDAAPIETAVVVYADKRAGQRLESVGSRFAGWERRYPDGWPPEMSRLALERARSLERRVCEAADVAPEGVGRLGWAGPALRAAAGAAGPSRVRT